MMPTELALGSSVGPWRVLKRLDWGNYGVVFLAQRASHPESPPAALKLARNPDDPRFEREGQLLQRTPHPNIPRYEDSGEWISPEGHRYPYVVMELVEGLTLYDWFRAQRRSSRQVLTVLQQVASALATAHAGGAVHRDVKGGNIRVTAQGWAVLVDWGSGWFDGAHPLTDTSAPPGTTAYRSPEQRLFIWRFQRDLEARWRARPSDDLYALGVTLYRLVTGGYLPPLTDGGEPVEREVPRPSALATVCRELETLILRLIDDAREARGNAEQLVREVEVLVRTAGPEADMPILPAASTMPPEEGASSSDGRQDEEVLSGTDEARRPSRSAQAREEDYPSRAPLLTLWLHCASVIAVGCFLVFVGWEMHRSASEQQPAPPPWIATPEEREQFAPDAGVGEDTLSVIQDAPRVVTPLVLSVGAPIPKKPQQGQKRTPCDPGQVAINGACWAGPIRGKEAPCPLGMFDHEGDCYLPCYDTPRQPTSDPP